MTIFLNDFFPCFSSFNKLLQQFYGNFKTGSKKNIVPLPDCSCKKSKFNFHHIFLSYKEKRKCHVTRIVKSKDKLNYHILTSWANVIPLSLLLLHTVAYIKEGVWGKTQSVTVLRNDTETHNHRYFQYKYIILLNICLVWTAFILNIFNFMEIHWIIWKCNRYILKK